MHQVHIYFICVYPCLSVSIRGKLLSCHKEPVGKPRAGIIFVLSAAVELRTSKDIKLQIVPGLRFDRWDFHRTQQHALQPRISSRWEFRDGMTVKAAYGRYEKVPEPNFLIDRPLGNPKLQPLLSHHFILGYEHEFTDLINIDVQGFYNLRRRIPSPSNTIRIQDGVIGPRGFVPLADAKHICDAYCARRYFGLNDDVVECLSRRIP